VSDGLEKTGRLSSALARSLPTLESARDNGLYRVESAGELAELKIGVATICDGEAVSLEDFYDFVCGCRPDLVPYLPG
jgi:hypothetical protein